MFGSMEMRDMQITPAIAHELVRQPFLTALPLLAWCVDFSVWTPIAKFSCLDLMEATDKN